MDACSKSVGAGYAARSGCHVPAARVGRDAAWTARVVILRGLFLRCGWLLLWSPWQGDSPRLIAVPLSLLAERLALRTWRWPVPPCAPVEWQPNPPTPSWQAFPRSLSMPVVRQALVWPSRLPLPYSPLRPACSAPSSSLSLASESWPAHLHLHFQMIYSF
jgi:hypothetical protein